MVTADKKKLARVTFGIYVLGLLCITFIVRETMVLRMPDNRDIVLEPFREADAMIHQPNHFFWFMQIFLNILLFMPFGALFPTISEKFRNPFATVLCGFLFSVGIESLQYITGRGLTEIDDVINNTVGALTGYLLFALISHLYKRRTDF
ncbi:MAG: VanZ family protein [Ruminococcus sp.]|nr:VanZ family protein [Ruminococcus sp.]